ncbi:MAG: hypothetical protein HBSAPP03_18040 [Phycisphaerae bacterium]|nr:MAG: hypothetical protein HBSAPP03_18040 [Phycisphaerae bacterium]
MNESAKDANQAVVAREQARALLGVLLNAQRDAERSAGRSDLFKRVTGTSSLEKSIAATRKLIESYDRLIGDTQPHENHETATDGQAIESVRTLNLTATYAARSA